jgi:L-arabinokinase
MLVSYVSGHGYGHSTRLAEVLRAVRALDPALPLAIVTSAPEFLYRDVVPGGFVYRAVECDVGLAQSGALNIDETGTLTRLAEYRASFAGLVDQEARFLRASGARLVLADIPPLAFAAAAAAGVPAVALGNFSWDWIYRHLAKHNAAFGPAADWVEHNYTTAELLLRLPFAGDMSVFPEIVDIPLVARKPRIPKAEARRRLGLDARPVSLLSFGGIGLPGLDLEHIARLTEVTWLAPEEFTNVPANCRRLTREWMKEIDIGYIDVVGAADAVVTKPGYGIVSDAIGAGTRLLYTERGDFPEYPILVAGMQQFIPCLYVSNADLLAGRLAEPLAALLAQPVRVTMRTDGAETAARELVKRARSAPAPTSNIS